MAARNENEEYRVVYRQLKPTVSGGAWLVTNEESFNRSIADTKRAGIPTKIKITHGPPRDEYTAEHYTDFWMDIIDPNFKSGDPSAKNKIEHYMKVYGTEWVSRPVDLTTPDSVRRMKRVSTVRAQVHGAGGSGAAVLSGGVTKSVSETKVRKEPVTDIGAPARKKRAGQAQKRVAARRVSADKAVITALVSDAKKVRVKVQTVDLTEDSTSEEEFLNLKILATCAGSMGRVSEGEKAGTSGQQRQRTKEDEDKDSKKRKLEDTDESD